MAYMLYVEQAHSGRSRQRGQTPELQEVRYIYYAPRRWVAGRRRGFGACMASPADLVAHMHTESWVIKGIWFPEQCQHACVTNKGVDLALLAKGWEFFLNPISIREWGYYIILK